MKATWTNVPLFTLAALGACAGDDMGGGPPEAIDFREWDSGGVRTVESSGIALETSLSWVADMVPNLELGELESGGSFQFHGIGGIVGLPGGGLVVLDGGSQELRWFDASGEHVRTVGGQGQGPGEFRNALLVPQFQADSLLIFDRVPRTFTWVAIDGSGVRAVGPPGPGEQLFVGTPRTAMGSRVLFSSASGNGSCPENRHCEVPLLLRWVDETATVADTLAVQHMRILNFVTSEGSRYFVTGPLDQRGLAAAGPGGPVLEGDPRFELRQFDTGGRLIAIFRVDAPPRIEPQDALDQFVQRSPAPDQVRRTLEMMELPEVVPAFQDLRVDHLGWYWARLFRPDEGGPSEWLVSDPEGRAQGMIELPSELEVHDIGEDYVLGRWIDELGVEYVRRHALDRRGS